MSYNSHSNTSISTRNSETFRTRTHTYKFEFTGLRPKTKHKMYLDDIDYTWACKGFGQKIGEDLLSDVNGKLMVYVLYEIQFSRPAMFEMKETQSIAYYSNKLNNQNSRMEDKVRVSWKTFQIKSADGLSHAELNMHFHTVLINGDYNSIIQHD